MFHVETKFDIIVIGGGHAGCEAAAAAAKLGSRTLLISMNLETLAKMSCNPAMGGVAKGQIVREIDALGGLSGQVTDSATIQFRMLNTKKGPAMWSPRAQCDRFQFSANYRKRLEELEHLHFFQDMATTITKKKQFHIGTQMGYTFYSSSVVLTSGTFLNGSIHIGKDQYGGGRMSERPSIGITESLHRLGFSSARMKTGTPPRILSSTIDFSQTDIQHGDKNPKSFSFQRQKRLSVQRPCYITYTNNESHNVIRENLEKSAIFNGNIEGIGPRYCPSIEDKVNRFADKDRHQMFIEPEGWNTNEVYINGFSSSLPKETQQEALLKIPAFRKAQILRPGYAIEYDYFPPTQLKHNLETKLVEGLFFAGQINGTTGYEEAAAQGLMAGINAHHKIRQSESLILGRDQAYIGVLIDDLITKGTDEPYRMFTSRAEYRLHLRQDNADERLMPVGYDLGLITQSAFQQMASDQSTVTKTIQYFSSHHIKPSEMQKIEPIDKLATPKHALSFSKLLSRPQVHIQDLFNVEREEFPFSNLDASILQKVETQIKYQGYLRREAETVDKFIQFKELNIPQNIDYKSFMSISTEGKQKLSDIQPKTFGEAQKISGVSQSDLSTLLIYLGR